jgi:thiamine biosynthesis lipoprotein
MAIQPTHGHFDAFGTYGFLAVRRAEALAEPLALTERVVADGDATSSRFRADTDLTPANRHPGHWVDVDPLLVAAVEVACEAADRTGGLVSPLLGRPLVQLGYDRDFGELAPATGAVDLPWVDVPDVLDVPDLDAWRDLGLDRTGRLRVPAGTALDLGSTGKAWAADLVATGLERELGISAVVSLGGDVRVAGPDGRPWPVAISDSPGAEPATRVGLDAGGLATSSTRVRRWSQGGIARHHLLDPRTGRPAPEVWRTVTATGPTCVAANTASTAAIVLGHEAPEWLREHGVTARLVAADGTPAYLGGWPPDPRPVDAHREAS